MKTRTQALGLAAAATLLLANCTCIDGGHSALAPDADAALRSMSDKLSAADQFRFEGSRVVDPELAPGRGVVRRARVEGAVVRPDKLAGKSVGGGTTRRFIYDGRNVTLHDVEMNHYATVAGARSIDRTIDKITERWDFNPPMADLLVSDPYCSLTRGVTSGRLVGREVVGGARCKHISATGEEVDWDLWLAESDDLPRKFRITFKNRAGRPAVELRIHRWDLDPELDAGQFVFAPPAGAQEIEMAPAGR